VDIDSAKMEQQPTHTIIRSIKVSPNLDIDSITSTIIMKPFDQVYVRKNPTFELQQLIEVNGLVKYPGPYPRLSKYEHLSSFIDRAGGMKENADLGGALLYRKKIQYFRENVTKKVNTLTDSIGRIRMDSVKTEISEVSNEPISIDLFRALKYRNSKYDIVLQEGDVLIIPEINPFVQVKGTVQNPLKLAFDKEHANVGYYIDKAGGFGQRPWRSRIYVQYANGKSSRTRTFFFIHFYPKVEQGSVVVVPVKPEGRGVTEFAQQALLSVVPVVTAALIARILLKL
jgi:protein involved in polysaccharide export with SLBB domain